LKKLEEIVEAYDPDCVFNMDETGLFFWLVPWHTVLLPSEDLSIVHGKKKSMDRVTLAVCCNATGTKHLPFTLIGKQKNLHVFIIASGHCCIIINPKHGWVYQF